MRAVPLIISVERKYIGVAGDWQDDGACTTVALAPGQFITVHYESKSVPLSVPVKTPGAKHSRFSKL